MKNNLQQKVTLSLLAGAMLFGTGYIANTSVVYAAIASKDINFESNISDGMTRNGLTVREQAENDEKAENNTIIISGGDAYDVYAAVTGGGDAVGNTAQILWYRNCAGERRGNEWRYSAEFIWRCYL